MTALRALVYPEPVLPYHSLRRLLDDNGWEWTGDPHASFDFAVSWKNYFHRLADPGYDGHRVLSALHRQGMPVINFRVNSTQKTQVEALQRKVFGYGAFVDPCTFEGPAVEKSNEQARGDARMVECPLAPEAVVPGRIYTRWIDTTRPGGYCETIRTIVVDRRPCFVSFSRYRIEHRVLGPSLAFDAEPGLPDVAYSDDELARLCTYFESFGLDLGEVDVLRDATDGRIYVIDVNATGGGYDRYFDPQMRGYVNVDPRYLPNFRRRAAHVAPYYTAPFREMVLARLGAGTR